MAAGSCRRSCSPATSATSTPCSSGGSISASPRSRPVRWRAYRARIHALIDTHAEIRDAFWWLMSLENSVAAEWAVGLGRRSAEERLAHLFCELLVRLTAVERSRDNAFLLPLTQDELGDIVGISTVHVNRTLQALRTKGLIRLDERHLTICDWAALTDLVDFQAGYLHLEGLRLPDVTLSI